MRIICLATFFFGLLISASFANSEFTNYSIQDVYDGKKYCEEIIKPINKTSKLSRKYLKKCVDIYLMKMSVIHDVTQACEKNFRALEKAKNQEEIFLRYPHHNALISNIPIVPKNSFFVSDPILRSALGYPKSLREKLIGF